MLRFWDSYPYPPALNLSSLPPSHPRPPGPSQPLRTLRKLLQKQEVYHPSKHLPNPPTIQHLQGLLRVPVPPGLGLDFGH